MKLKSLAIAVALLAVLAGTAYWANRTPSAPPADPRVNQPLASPTLAPRIERVRITDQGKSVELDRQPDGTWRVPAYYDFPADFSKISSLVSDLTSDKVDRLVTEDPDRLARLDLGQTKIEFLDSQGRVFWSLSLGKTSDTGGRFVRFGDEPKAYLAQFDSSTDSDPKSWADAALTNLKPDDVARIEIPFGQGAVTVSRTKSDQPWTASSTPPGQRVSADKISSLLGSLDTLRFTDTADPADPNVAAARRHLRTFRLTTFAGKTYTISLGRKPEEKKPAPARPAAPGKGPAAAKETPPAAEPETVPAGPVYAFVTDPQPDAPVNALMSKRAFQIDDYIFTGLPQNPSDLFEPAPAAAKK